MTPAVMPAQRLPAPPAPPLSISSNRPPPRPPPPPPPTSMLSPSLSSRLRRRCPRSWHRAASLRASVRPCRGWGGGGSLFGDDDDGDDIDVGGGSGGGQGGGLFDDIDDGGAGGAGDRCAGISAGVMALTLEMRFSVGTVGCSICGCWWSKKSVRGVRKNICSDTHSHTHSYVKEVIETA